MIQHTHRKKLLFKGDTKVALAKAITPVCGHQLAQGKDFRQSYQATLRISVNYVLRLCLGTFIMAYVLKGLNSTKCSSW